MRFIGEVYEKISTLRSMCKLGSIDDGKKILNEELLAQKSQNMGEMECRVRYMLKHDS